MLWNKSESEFQIAMAVSFEQLINKHQYCGEWLKYIKFPKEHYAINAQDNYKVHDNSWIHIYLQAKEIHELYTPDENLQMLHHELKCQKMKQGTWASACIC